MATVVIDPGHGGAARVDDSSPNNASSPSGLLEKNLTLIVARHAESALTGRGHTVRLTRSSNVNLGLADRARVAQAAQAAAFVSIHFNGFADPTVQGTETWVHELASPRSRELAGCVQRAVLRATGYRDRGVQAKRLGVLSPGRHAPQTAACLAEISFITTAAEDQRLQDEAYLRALGEAVASGVHEFLERSITRLTAGALAATGSRLADVRQAISALPKKGRKARFAGPVSSDGDPNSHIQGVAGYKDFFLLTHSDTSKDSGRILVVDRRPGQQKLVKEFRLPRLGGPGASFHHAGGCQVVGDVLAVPSETGQNQSAVAFFDLSDPLNIQELHPTLRISRDSRDAAAVGITAVTRSGQEAWLAAVYDSGTVDFYESPDLPGGAPFAHLFSFKVQEKHHQSLLLLTDASDRVFAVGLNRTFLGSNDLVLYEVDLVGQSMTVDLRRAYLPDGGALRWGAGLEVRGQGLVMHCTSRNYGSRCTVSAFDPAAPRVARAIRPRATRARKAAKASRRRVGTTKRAARARKKGA
jgi:N-acetylmuramoyl-L-alanine amidase